MPHRLEASKREKLPRDRGYKLKRVRNIENTSQADYDFYIDMVSNGDEDVELALVREALGALQNVRKLLSRIGGRSKLVEGRAAINLL